MLTAISLTILWICIILNILSLIINIVKIRANERGYKAAGETCCKAWELYDEARKYLISAKKQLSEAEELRAKAAKHLSEVEAIYSGDRTQNN